MNWKWRYKEWCSSFLWLISFSCFKKLRRENVRYALIYILDNSYFDHILWRKISKSDCVCVLAFIYLFPTYFNKSYSRHRNIGSECPQVNSEALGHGENFNSFQCLLHIFKFACTEVVFFLIESCSSEKYLSNPLNKNSLNIFLSSLRTSNSKSQGSQINF